MRGSDLSEDLAFARKLAEEGAAAPSLSGRFSVLWGSLVMTALIIQWTIEIGWLMIHPASIGLLWLGVAILGGAGTAALSRGLANKPGLGSAINRSQNAAWPVVAIGIFLYAGAIAFAVVGRGQSPLLFDTIMPVAFLLYAAVQAASAALGRAAILHAMTVLSLVFAVVSAAMIGMPAVYLVAALGVGLTQIAPGLLALRAEPRTV